MRFLVFAALVLLIAVVGAQLYRLYGERSVLVGEAEKIDERIENLKSENKDIAADIAYLSVFDNLVKELKTLFNYRRPGEKLYIIIPREENNNVQ